ncbi:MAG: hypothetical protein B7Z66_11690 [Chromatiales bacterium 21-64-14]|nr:MAG: hypothetical protein B7Z66_11690 [Chromatiales bacterium 21-64-14]
MRANIKIITISLLGLAVVLFFAWRMLRPLHVFTVAKDFEYPLVTRKIPPPLPNLSAATCGTCHRAIYREWITTMHSRSWTDPYFRTDRRLEGNEQICLNCHTPLDRQQKFRVLGFHDGNKFDPILAPNPEFSPELRRQGVTCAACHVRHGVIYGPFSQNAMRDAPHPTAQWENDNEACVRCHVAPDKSWGVFLAMPPCGTVPEIQLTQKEVLESKISGHLLLKIPPPIPRTGARAWVPKAGYPSADGSVDGYLGQPVPPEVATANCVECHMPRVQRPLMTGYPPRWGRHHLWRGGHDPQMVRQSLSIRFRAEKPLHGSVAYVLTITNTGAEHYVPTGVPDRFISVDLRLLGSGGRTLEHEHYRLTRFIMWRPFVIQFWDTRLRPMVPQHFAIKADLQAYPDAVAVEAVVRYHLLPAAHRRKDRLPMDVAPSSTVFRKRILIHGHDAATHRGHGSKFSKG